MKRIILAFAIVLALFSGQISLVANADVPSVDFSSWGTPNIEGQNPYPNYLSIGSPLSASAGIGWPEGTTFEVEWLRDGVAIPNSGLFIYTPAEDDRGHHLSFRVTGSLDGYVSKTVTSARTTYMLPPRVTISGQYLVGKTLTALSPAIPGVTYKYQWYRNYGQTPIAGATKSTFKIPDSMVLDNATAAAQAFENGVQVSDGELFINDLTSITGGKHIAANFKVSLGGAVMVDRLMTGRATNLGGRGDCVEYWLRDGKTRLSILDGALGYYPVAADVGHSVTYKMVCRFPGRLGSTTKTVASRKIVKAPLFEGTPSVTGSASVGSTVTASEQELLGQHWTPGTTFTYQWLKNGKKIARATASSYLIPIGFAGQKISVTVTGHKPGYTTESMTSSKVLVSP